MRRCHVSFSNILIEGPTYNATQKCMIVSSAGNVLNRIIEVSQYTFPTQLDTEKVLQQMYSNASTLKHIVIHIKDDTQRLLHQI